VLRVRDGRPSRHRVAVAKVEPKPDISSVTASKKR